MLNCALENLENCPGSTEALAYLFDVIRRNSLCFKRKNVSEVIESDDDIENIVVE